MRMFLFLFTFSAMVWFAKATLGGKNATQEQFPYQVSLRNNQLHICGGVILTETAILTAAHCIFNYDIKGLTVVSGTIDLNEGDVKRIIATASHREYNTTTLANNIALVFVQDPFVFSTFVQPIKLPPTSNIPNTLTVSGWGFYNLPRKLQYLQIRTISSQICANETKRPVDEKHVCSKEENYVGSSQEDFGGPVTDGEGSNLVLYGIVSWRSDPITTGRFLIPSIKPRYSIYTNVYYYKAWINQYKERNSFPYVSCFYRNGIKECITF